MNASFQPYNTDLRTAFIVLRRLHGESGQVLILFAAGLVLFFGLVGMSIDVGQIVFARTDLQKIADASALAGSEDLPGSTANATTSANSYATKNGVSTTSISFGSANTTITVQATRHVRYTFLKVLGMSGRDVSATATAKATHTNITGYSWNATAPFVIWGGNGSVAPPSGLTYTSATTRLIA